MIAMSSNTSDARLAARGAFAGSALFIALIVAFSSLGGRQPAPLLLFVMGLIGAASHLVLLPAVATLEAPAWARVGGYAWIAIDVMLNVATVNGLDPRIVAPLRLGGHVPAALWMDTVAYGATGSVRVVGLPLALVLMTHAMVSPWIPAWVLFIPFMTIPIWLALVGRYLQRDAVMAQAVARV